MKSTFAYLKYAILPEYSEESHLTDLFLENKFWGWTGLLIIFLLICIIIYFQIKIWESEDENSRKSERGRKTLKQKN